MVATVTAVFLHADLQHRLERCVFLFLGSGVEPPDGQMSYLLLSLGRVGGSIVLLCLIIIVSQSGLVGCLWALC